MSDPNVNASPESIADSLSGVDGTGAALDYRLVTLLATWKGNGGANLAQPEATNTSASALDQIVTLAKILTQETPDGLNAFDLLVAIRNAVAPAAPKAS